MHAASRGTKLSLIMDAEAWNLQFNTESTVFSMYSTELYATFIVPVQSLSDRMFLYTCTAGTSSKARA